jgi:hypothetical protein
VVAVKAISRGAGGVDHEVLMEQVGRLKSQVLALTQQLQVARTANHRSVRYQKLKSTTLRGTAGDRMGGGVGGGQAGE